MDGILFENPDTNFFSFNNPHGACEKCKGYGDIVGIDEKLVVPNTSLSVYDGAIFPWRGKKLSNYKNLFKLPKVAVCSGCMVCNISQGAALPSS